MKQIDKEKFGAFIAQKRKEKNMTQKDLAEKVYVSAQAVSKWERGQSLPDISLFMPLAEILQVSLVSLIEGEEEVMKDPKTEGLLQKIVEINEEKELKRAKISMKKLGTLAIILSLVGGEYFILYKYFGLNINNFLTSGILGLVFSSYFWLLADDRLPSYYDANKISFVSDGIFRMNMVGVYFNNKNWKPILKYLRVWVILMMAVYPLLGFIQGTKAVIAMAIFLVLGFLPIYIIAKKYE